jgi:hypothetical protein
MINAWSLAYDVLNGTIDKEYPIMSEGQKIPGRDVSDIAYGGLMPEDGQPYRQDFLADNDDNAAHHFQVSGDISGEPEKDDDLYRYHYPPNYPPKPSIEKAAYKKYEEDKSIKDLQDYITSTYGGHYTNAGSNVQTLDLIESVGDAESFCRSNAIKYLSRYDKKGQAKRDILKAMHYTLLLYYFSGNIKDDETPTRGYETF